VDLRQVRYFIAVAQHLHFCRAARRLKISQPTLSQQIRALEKQVGAELFDRNPKGIALSTAGSAFLNRARQAVREADAAIQDARDAKNGVDGHLKILCGPLAEYVLLKDVLRLMRDSFPTLVIEIDFSPGINHLGSIADGTFDAAFMTSHSSSSNPSLLSEPLYHEECVVMLPNDHPLARSRTVSLSQLVHETWILTDLCETAMEEERLASSCRAAGVQPKLLRPTDWHSVFPLVASGAGISLVPAALETIRRPELRFVPLSPAMQIPVNLIRRREDTSPYLLQFLEHATQAVAARSGTPVRGVTLGSATRKIPTAHHAAARGMMRRVAVQMPVPALQVSRPAGRERSRLVLRRAG